MLPRLNRSLKIWRFAKDLGISPTDEPVNDILHYCKKKVNKFLNDFPDCKTLTSLLECIAAKVGTSFEEIHSDKDVDYIKEKYLAKGEKIFVRLDDEFSDDVYGITLKLTNRESWEPRFVSIIDYRGDKAYRAYYTKWHEIAHLLVLTDQMRLKFTRTLHLDEKDPEEVLIDIIAGHFGFYPQLIRAHADREISFEEIENIRQQLCPEASYQSAIINFVKAWPSPCMLADCTLALKRGEQALLAQQSFDFRHLISPVLRATRVTSNESALKSDLRIFDNMRVPVSSIIHKVFHDELNYAEAEENLSWWEASNGTRLCDMRIRVKAKKAWDSVNALIIPLL